VAQICNVAPRTVSKWFDSGQLKGYRIPGSKDRRIPLNELLAFMRIHDIPTDHVQRGECRILIIDNRSDYAENLTNSLHARGNFEVSCAVNIFEAGLLALKFSPNFILIDLMSSGIDAAKVCSYIRQSEDLQGCVLLALAGGLCENEAEHLYNYGFDGIVLNSQNVDNIVHAIRNAECAAY
jgi:CheY-like chemotaxis protein